MKIYTRTGDKGNTSLFSGQRVPKDNPFIEALGTIDEANCMIGLAIAHLPNQDNLKETKEQLTNIQHALFDVGAALATPRTCHQPQKLEKTRFDAEEIQWIENWIDAMEEKLPTLKTFILPGGHPAGSALHLARSIVRRAERHAVPLYQQSDVTQAVLTYLNRLSDYLFVASRYINHLLKIEEACWQPHKMSEAHSSI